MGYDEKIYRMIEEYEKSKRVVIRAEDLTVVSERLKTYKRKVRVLYDTGSEYFLIEKKDDGVHIRLFRADTVTEGEKNRLADEDSVEVVVPADARLNHLQDPLALFNDDVLVKISFERAEKAKVEVRDTLSRLGGSESKATREVRIVHTPVKRGLVWNGSLPLVLGKGENGIKHLEIPREIYNFGGLGLQRSYWGNYVMFSFLNDGMLFHFDVGHFRADIRVPLYLAKEVKYYWDEVTGEFEMSAEYGGVVYRVKFNPPEKEEMMGIYNQFINMIINNLNHYARKVSYGRVEVREDSYKISFKEVLNKRVVCKGSICTAILELADESDKVWRLRIARNMREREFVGLLIERQKQDGSFERVGRHFAREIEIQPDYIRVGDMIYSLPDDGKILLEDFEEWMESLEEQSASAEQEAEI